MTKKFWNYYFRFGRLNNHKLVYAFGNAPPPHSRPPHSPAQPQWTWTHLKGPDSDYISLDLHVIIKWSLSRIQST